MPKQIKTPEGVELNLAERTGSVQLSLAHTIVMSHRPKVITAEDLSNQLIKGSNSEVLSFGLFESSSPNYTTYYPDVTAEDLNPKDEEFIMPVFRMLSETIVSKYAPIDFSKPGVLKKSMKKLLGQTVNVDHETMVGNAVGVVADVYWQESYKSKDGITVPAGINATLKIDGKSNPRIARGIMMEPPSIHSNSVTVRFEWEPSHTFNNISEFYNKLGTYDKDGELIRLVVTNIASYHETSLVSHGADVFAQKIGDDGQIINPRYAKSVYQFSAGKPVFAKTFFDFKEGELKFSAESAIPETFNINNTDNPSKISMEEFIKNLCTEYNLDAEAVTEDNLLETVKNLIANASQDEEDDSLQSQVSQLTTEKTNLETQVSTLTTERDNFKTKVTQFDAVLTAQRNEATRLYKLCKGDEAEDAIVKLIAEGTIEVVTSFIKQYTKEANEKYPMTCKKCNSTEVERASAIVPNPNAGIQNEGEERDDIEVLDNIREKKRKSRTNLAVRED